MDCHYCGAPASTKDHIIPIGYNYNQRPDRHRSKGGETVDCCSECNSLLGAKALFSIQERAHEIAECLERRYKKELNAPIWSEEELEELGPTLQKQIKAKQFLILPFTYRLVSFNNAKADLEDILQFDAMRQDGK